MAWLRRGVIAVLALAVVALGWAIWRINAIAERLIEEQGTRALGVDTTIDFISIRFLPPPSLRIGGFEIENPPGFGEKNFFTLGSGTFLADFGSLLEPTIVAPQLVLDGVEISIERELRRTNYGVILANLKRTHSGKDVEPEAQAAPRRTFRIDEVLIRDLTAHLSLELAGRSQSGQVHLPEVRLTGVGSGGDGAVPGQLLSVIVVGILDALVQKGELPLELAADLTGSLEGLARVPLQVTGEVAHVGEGLLGGAVENLGDAAGRAAGGAVDKTRKGLGKLIPGGEEE